MRLLSLAAVWAYMSLFLMADEQVSMSVSVKSSLDHFSGRLLRGLKSEIESSELFYWSGKQKKLDGRVGHLDVSISYPIRAFSNQETLYIKTNGLSEGPRYICFSHAVSPTETGLSVEQGNQLIAEVSQRMVEILSLNWKNDAREDLEPGYFSNRYELDLGKVLDVELVRPLGAIHRPLTEPEENKDWEKSTSLKEKERLVEDLSLASDGIAPEPRKRSRRRQRIIADLEAETVTEKRAKLYVEMAELHADVGLTQEAAGYIERSLEEKPTVEAHQMGSDLKMGKEDPTYRLRRWGRDRGSSLEVVLGLEYDSNVVREEIDAFDDSQAKDWKLSLTGKWVQKWKLDSWGWSNTTKYSFHNENHTKHSELDVIYQDLLHEWGRHLTQGDWKYDLRIGVGGHHLMSRGTHWMLGWKHRVGMDWYRSPKNVYSVFFLSSQKDFSSNFFDHEERTGEHRALRLGWSHGFDDKKRGSIGATWLMDDLGDATLSYNGFSCDGRYDSVDVFGFFDKTSLIARYEKREYKAAQFPRAIREDAEFFYGVEAQKKFFEQHLFTCSYGFTDHQSTRRVEKYQRNQVGFNYLVSF